VYLLSQVAVYCNPRLNGAPEKEKTLYSLIQTLGIQVAMKRELAPFVVAFAIAELFYRFRSFSLECIAFLITWAILSYLQSLVVGRRGN
jgi:hypothetical protein